jgi:hypothetical protein
MNIARHTTSDKTFIEVLPLGFEQTVKL